jgi:hypothetical protein
MLVSVCNKLSKLDGCSKDFATAASWLVNLAKLGLVKVSKSFKE